jgi:two-component system chemotaxis response regulator CheY
MKILVVDDDVVSRLALAELLQDWTLFEVVLAEDGQAAWRLLEQGLRPLICFCDVRMPHLSGLDLLERIKAHPALSQVPFVLVSSASDRATVLQAVKLGAVGYILKPVQAASARDHLDNLFRIALDKALEDPRATQHRLAIDGGRLGGYLDALDQQLDNARASLGQLQGGKAQEVRARLDAVHTACATLGLWRGVALLGSLRGVALDLRKVQAALDEVADLVARQRRRLQPHADRSCGTPAPVTALASAAASVLASAPMQGAAAGAGAAAAALSGMPASGPCAETDAPGTAVPPGALSGGAGGGPVLVPGGADAPSASGAQAMRLPGPRVLV